ncbi:hypothetical protein LR48_Vigan346s000700 [Vigna angularis]|uniref:ABC transporter domain-containing protein n=1 Tax=Phaseolus angularis TaxID=3914 RepID=A0A0L9T8J7_PHAAN|nr:hypothetical protein LR48_Vigan346s000700 [Vigna angularis]
MFRRTKTLLNDISGEARNGEIMAVLGASGSGKSTLIDALANRITKRSLKGTVVLNDETLESRLLKVISAYVMQDDLLFLVLTVEETLMFVAKFRLSHTLSKLKKNTRVQALIEQPGLRNAAKTVIGDEGHRGESGSNNGSNSQNGGNTTVNAGGTNMKSDNELSENSCSSNASRSRTVDVGVVEEVRVGEDDKVKKELTRAEGGGRG